MLFGLSLLVFALAVQALPSLAKTTPLTYTFKKQISDATIGKAYHYSFCTPEAGKGKFCGKVLPKANQTKNPIGGTPPYTFKAGVGLPFGLSMNLNGVITGKPKSNTPTGLRHFQLCVKDHVGKQKCKTTFINVKKAVKTTTPTTAQYKTTITSLTCSYVSTGSYYDYTQEQQYVYHVTASGTATGPVNTEIAPHLYIDLANVWAKNYPNVPDVTAPSWVVDSDHTSYFRRTSTSPTTTNWTMNQDITIDYSPIDAAHAWPDPTKFRLQAELLDYWGPGSYGGAAGDTFGNITCPQP